jgi:glycosyltransferase involved in cell wall biosynthesis
MPEIVSGLVSTIIPVYNRSDMMREAVQSVLDQSYQPIEIIIVDDGSTDDVPAVGEQLAKDYPDFIRFLRKSNSGAGPTREAGRQLARGEFIQYLDSDDLLLPEKFQLQVDALRAEPDCGIAYGWIILEQDDGERLTTPYKCSGEQRETLFPWLLADRWWNTNTPLWRRSVCDLLGPWSDLRWSQDWEYDARAAALGVRLAYVPEFVTVQRQHSGTRQTADANWLEPERIRNRRYFLEMLLTHAKRGGVESHNPHRKHFSRWAFALARNAARAGAIEDAKALMKVAVESAGDQNDSKSGFFLFRSLTAIVGWQFAACMLAIMEQFKRPSSMTLPESFSKQRLMPSERSDSSNED